MGHDRDNSPMIHPIPVCYEDLPTSHYGTIGMDPHCRLANKVQAPGIGQKHEELHPISASFTINEKGTAPNGGFLPHLIVLAERGFDARGTR